ncbi:hypothetical protein ES319_D08G092900v1 [Gossypium barbadense]|uniref:Uncharacterized protein n=1 Tax=Gossypium barbadense TaxID=3634 RepID=A0A5J5QBI9_GOSBA|nr:hypothetical protein ES319_D08G092900v1 [Gossypium barbadense]
MTPISTKKKRRIVRQMAENLMHALQYNSYGGGAVALKTGQAMASALNVVQTSHSYGDLMLLMKAAELQQVCAALGGFFYYVFK